MRRRGPSPAFGQAQEDRAAGVFDGAASGMYYMFDYSPLNYTNKSYGYGLVILRKKIFPQLLTSR